MIITTKCVNKSQLDENAAFIQNEESMINLDRNDIKTILVDQEGVLYQAVQDEAWIIVRF